MPFKNFEIVRSALESIEGRDSLLTWMESSLPQESLQEIEGILLQYLPEEIKSQKLENIRQQLLSLGFDNDAITIAANGLGIARKKDI